MSKLFFAAIILVASFSFVGCGSQDTSATKAEESAFKNPPKTPPAGALQHGGPPAQGQTAPPAPGQ